MNVICLSSGVLGSILSLSLSLMKELCNVADFWGL